MESDGNAHVFLRGHLSGLPFSPADVTAGVENELQAVVKGSRDSVDLPLAIAGSNYYANIVKRAVSGEARRREVTALEDFLAANDEGVWEHSWVRFPRRCLSPGAVEILEEDLRADRRDPDSGPRRDRERFLFEKAGEDWVRVPVSYLLKIALADAVLSPGPLPRGIRLAGRALLDHFLNDNVSPETTSFFVHEGGGGWGPGRAAALETALRYLLTQLIVRYANIKFDLVQNDQEVVVYFAPCPPVRLRELNEIISDAFYAELFVSPCLSGWDRGEEKYRYMLLCHQVLGRSQLNAIGKLRDAGIVTNNLVVLPNTSHIGLANNGTHVTLGSKALTRLLAEGHPWFGPRQEKYIGDLVTKVVEHFLPLFVGTYTAAPWRLSFAEFHPEKVLGYLPHELDFTHLRMIWRRWKGKARNKVLGRAFTPFGPRWIDRPLSALLGLKGDFVPDFRLVDYFVSLMSTESSPGLDGRLGNQERLKRDLATLGVFDPAMATYLLFRQREYEKSGFFGFEARHYSLFEGFDRDMTPAVDLQALVTAFAFRSVLHSEVRHEHIPDDPETESERRQIFFGAAIGIPTFFVRKGTRNAFLKRVMERTEKVRESRRYPGFLRVHNDEYRKALVRVLREDGADLIEDFGLEDTVRDLSERFELHGEKDALSRITSGVIQTAGQRDAFSCEARAFNVAAERYFRTTLRRRHVTEAYAFFKETIRSLEGSGALDGRQERESIRAVLKGRSALEIVQEAEKDICQDAAHLDLTVRIIHLLILVIHILAGRNTAVHPFEEIISHDAPVYRTGIG